MAGAPKGNQNATKGRVWTEAINRALAARSRRDGVLALDALADKLLELANQGEFQALKELGDRLEGKAIQPTEVEMSGEVAIKEIRRTLVKP